MDGGQVSVNTVLLSFIALVTLIGPGILLWMNAKLAADTKAREEALEDRKAAGILAAGEKAATAATLAAERDAKQAASLAEIHTATNAQLSKLQEDLRASREETKAALAEAKALLVEKAAAPTAVPVYTPPGAALEVTADAAAPVPVVSVPPASG